MTAARPDGHGGWQLAVIRYGKLAAASTAPRGVPPLPAANELRTGAENVIPGPGPLRGSTADETTVLYRWLTSGETRLVNCVEPWAEPARSAGSWREWAKQASSARQPYGAAN
jgi:DNA polymerase-3 subunit epsilon